MSPEERAWAMLEKYSLVWGLESCSDRGLELMAETLASAIREAEASARNEALEEAAVYVEENSDAYDCWASADYIRTLKTKD